MKPVIINTGYFYEQMAKKLPTFTIGITTNHGKWHLVEAVKSIRDSIEVKDFPIIIVADDVPVTAKIKKALLELDATLIENPTPTSAFAKQKQILKNCDTELILLTQDDVIFPHHTIANIVKEFANNPGTTFVGIENIPLETGNWFSKVLNVGTRLCFHIGRDWNNGDNYLAMLGRMMAFRTDWLKKMYVATDSVSLDAYLYLENKLMGGKYVCLWDSPLYFLNPQNFIEHLRKSSRFRNSEFEMNSYHRFGDIRHEYQIPFKIVAKSIFKEFKSYPLATIGYAAVFGLITLTKQRPHECLTALWKVDLSTKQIAYRL